MLDKISISHAEQAALFLDRSLQLVSLSESCLQSVINANFQQSNLRTQISALLPCPPIASSPPLSQSELISIGHSLKIILLVYNAIMVMIQYTSDKSDFTYQLCYNSPVASPKGSSRPSLSFMPSPQRQSSKTNVFYSRSQLKSHINDKQSLEKYLHLLIEQSYKKQHANYDLETQQEQIANYFHYIQQKDYDTAQALLRSRSREQENRHKRVTQDAYRSLQIETEIEHRAVLMEDTLQRQDNELYYDSKATDLGIQTSLRDLK